MIRAARSVLKHTRILGRGMAATPEGMSSDRGSVYLEQMYSRWSEDRKSVHASWDAYFSGNSGASMPETESSHQNIQEYQGNDAEKVYHEKLSTIVYRYRRRAHEVANIDPLDIKLNHYNYKDPFVTVEEDPAHYGITEADLDRPIEFSSPLKGFHTSKSSWTPREVSKKLMEIYTGPIGYEYVHIPNIEVQDWLRERIEQTPTFELTKEETENLLDRILESQTFTDFCEKKYSSSKRFGIDGLDSTISGMEKLVDTANEQGVTNMIFGMAHRGRLNTLACVFEKPYEAVFTEFKDPGISKNLRSAEWGFSGDVKYHLGASQKRVYGDGSKISLTMLPNPSHLETVNPVVLGKTRSKIDFVGDKKGDKVVSVLVHGDAAFSGQGIVYETLQFEGLEGYTTNGTIHVVFNNHVGFTTNPGEGRSSPYCTDVMKTNDTFIMHVNADYPEHVDFCFKLALEYRIKFNKDVVIDVSGYRRYGHNEQDMPKFTQPLTYAKIEQREPMWKLYTKHLVEKGLFTQEEIDAKYNKFIEKLDKAFEASKTENFNPREWDSALWKSSMLVANTNTGNHVSPNTSITESIFKSTGKSINTLPPKKNFHPIIVKNYEARLQAIQTGKGIDWAGAESLAFATLLQEGFGVRLSGEDVRRGTFSHRHAGITDQKDYSIYFPIKSVLDKTEDVRFQVYNSPLSEYGVLGFDYGYSLGNPNCLTLWEAQFGDFSNVAQPITDQYIAGGERKWGVKSGLVLLLPHGFDGQGPEHSSARLERFLQMMDDDPYSQKFIDADQETQAKLANMCVCNITEPANYFHVLRRQLHRSDFRKPLIIMSPKKLLRLKEAKSNMEDFTNIKGFREVLPDTLEGSRKGDVKQVIFCSGQVYYDLAERRAELKRDDVAIVRIEQIAPLPYRQVAEQIQKYPGAEICWAQEEHRNQGAYTYIKERFEIILSKLGLDTQIRYIGRRISGSTAVGSLNTHKQQLAQLLDDAFSTK